ncbi:efflux transporter periplasmic adaptor subunit [Aliarcobacter trophiarum LMG 25534]|uniref:Efflux transporter periplasmic adaptor subunit n=1 Tax=Aliarcobacter trophiarum LMG 25534 TaxID=1032241 RepID=A0AAD0QJW6_9BACT|nr:efflux RND transporter periplasmic adaptor subunit [Aliarcobacter trophiarum]AXK49243.1 RND family efflux system, membrane fusion protein [Aliarcobacter trophiarum LMG 25534]RXI25280.1 efflux transporter periplasmic adaptor subunit [Aliarcobacter trophiarum]RXJ91478.1 efflux transporter periplasmic adaptor subunit [Aliarcobacter trophiarum LMG 25534]
MSKLRDELNLYRGSKSRYKYISFAIVALVIFLMIYIFLPKNKDEKVEYNTQKATIGDLTVVVSASGNIKPTNSVEIGIEVSGTIKEIFVDFNDEVRVGQVLAKIDTTKLEAVAESSRAALAIAKANQKESEVNLKNKKLLYDRTKKMFDNSNGKYPSQNEYDNAKFSYEAAISTLEASKSKVLQSQSNLKNDLQNLEKASVKSSIDGIVLNKEVEIGQTLAATMQAPKLFTLAKDLTNMDLVVSIDEADVADIKDGLDVTFTVDAYTNKEFNGKIKQVRLNPITTNGVVTYETVVSVDNSELLLKPGMTANAKIITKHKSKQLLIPNSSLRFIPKINSETSASKKPPFSGPPNFQKSQANSKQKASKDGFVSIYILENEKPKELKVKVIDSDSKQSSILSKELKEGDLVILSQKSQNAK